MIEKIPQETEMDSGNWVSRRISASAGQVDHIFETGLNGQVFQERDKKILTLANGKQVVEFISCSYLGLECDPRISNAARDAVERFGVHFAAARTRMVPVLCHSLDENLARIFGAPTVTFSTVGLVHQAVLPLLGAGELPSYPINNRVCWILDKTAHASIQLNRALMAQFGEVKRLDFGNLDELESAIQQASTSKCTPITVSDSVGSMGGEVQVDRILQLVNKFNGYAYLDDAHGTSVAGKFGAGYVLKITDGVFDKRLILCSSLSKGFGSNGGAVSFASQSDIEKIKKYSIPFAFGGPLPIGVVAACLASSEIHLSGEIHKLQDQLQTRLAVFDEALSEEVVNYQRYMPIRGIVIGNENDCIDVGLQLLKRGFYCTSAVFPTVPKNQAMIRLAISALHTEEQILDLVSQIKSIKDDSQNRSRNWSDRETEISC